MNKKKVKKYILQITLNKDDLLLNISLSDSKKNNFLIGNCDFFNTIYKIIFNIKK